MANAIKVRRHGLGITSNRKIPFRMWLNEQKRSELTYRKDVQRPDENGWTAEDFALEANKRGLDIRVWTAVKWCSGTQPREVRHSLARVFKTIRF